MRIAGKGMVMELEREALNYPEEGTMRKLITLLAALTLVAPLMFYGCSGDDGARGPQGLPGDNGAGGGPGTGIAAQETCGLCHGGLVQITDVHGLDPTTGDKLLAGTATVIITDVVFPAPTVDNYVKVQVDFTFQAFNSAGANITSSINLTTPSATNTLPLATFSIAKLVPGTGGSSNQWNSFVLDPGAGGSGPYRTIVAGGTRGAVFTRTPNTPAAGTDTYSYTFADNVLRISDGYVDNVVYRVTVQASNFDVTLFTSDPILQANGRRAAANAWRDQVGFIAGGATYPVPAGYPTKNDVTTEACNQCHDPLGFHSQSARRETTYCVVCHNVRSETVGRPAGGGFDNINLMNLVHKVHINYNLARALGWTKSPTDVFGVDVSEITYPQDIRNCTTCHTGTDDFWKSRPTIYTCTSCHAKTTFVAPATHSGGVKTDAQCAGCHDPDSIVGYHADGNTTPGNVPAGLDNILYFIDNVTVDNNVPVVGFHITKNGAPMTLTTWPPTGYLDTNGPTFLVAYTQTQDGITTPADYNNLGKAAAQPASVTLKSLAGSLTGGPSGYTARLTTALFPSTAKMRAVALQAYFTQLPTFDYNGDGAVNALDNVGRHTPAVQMPVKVGTTTDAVRRAVVDSNKCLECHKTLELHGGSRVNNVQVCVMCHNPNLSSSGRTTPAGITPIWGFGPLSGDAEGTPPIPATSAIPPLLNDPLIWPERSNNFRELVHGLHASDKRGAANPYQFVRLRSGNAYYFDFSEVRYPGDLTHCTKCHINGKFEGNLPAGVLYSTEETTNDNNTTAGITAARASVPNLTDVVNSPTASACGYCHDDTKARSHIVLQGGQIKAKRGTALQVPPSLAPDVLATP